MGHVFQVNRRRTAQVKHGIEFSASRFKFASHTTEPSGCLFGRSVLEFWNATENERIVYIYIYSVYICIYIYILCIYIYIHNIYIHIYIYTHNYYHIYILCYVIGKVTVSQNVANPNALEEIVEKKKIQNFVAKQ